MGQVIPSFGRSMYSSDKVHRGTFRGPLSYSARDDVADDNFGLPSRVLSTFPRPEMQAAFMIFYGLFLDVS